MLFSRENKRDLSVVLRKIPVHDGVFNNIKYNIKKNQLNMLIYNPIDNKSITLEFYGITFYFALGSNKWGKDNTILSLVLEDNYDLPKLILKNSDRNYISDLEKQANLYFIFQMLSGNEIHVICKKILIDLLDTD